MEKFPQYFDNNLEIDSSKSSSITTPTISPPPSKGGVGGMMKVPTGDSSGPTSQGIEGSRSRSGLSKFSSTDPNKSTVAEESIYFS